MSKVREGLNVIVIGENNQILRGKVKRTCDEISMAIVEFEDGSVKKVCYCNLGIDSVTRYNTDEPMKEEPEKVQDGAKVITKDQFTEAVKYVTSPERMVGDKDSDFDPLFVILNGMTTMIIGVEIIEELFKDKEEIVISKNQLTELIKENTKPSAIVKMADGKVSGYDVMPISLMSAVSMLKVVKILFDESENE